MLKTTTPWKCSSRRRAYVLISLLLFIVASLTCVATAFAAQPQLGSGGMQASSSTAPASARIANAVLARDEILTRKVVASATQAAVAFGLSGPLKVDTVWGLDIAKIYDQHLLTNQERDALGNSDGNVVGLGVPLQQTYIVVIARNGGGCIAAPQWAVWNHREKDSPIGITNMRCASTNGQFERLLKVALVAML